VKISRVNDDEAYPLYFTVPISLLAGGMDFAKIANFFTLSFEDHRNIIYGIKNDARIAGDRSCWLPKYLGYKGLNASSANEAAATIPMPYVFDMASFLEGNLVTALPALIYSFDEGGWRFEGYVE
jgi:hypothetical protein